MDEKRYPDMPVLTGQRWGQYQIIGPVEQGHFGRAYIGEHIQHPAKQLVVQIFPITLTIEAGTTFLQSGQSLMQLVHPSILRLFDVGIENRTPFIVLDSIPHIPLRQLYLQDQGQPLEKLLPYLRQIASALQYTHAEGRIHKHLCPDSVLLGPNNAVFLCDFAIDGIDAFFQSYQRRMFPIDPLSYLAPEQIQLQPVDASDQYALATMIYEWLCGTLPFLGSSAEIAQQQLYSAAPALRQKRITISPAVEEVVMTALVKDPSRRFATISAFVNALEQAYEPMPPTNLRDVALSMDGNATVPPMSDPWLPKRTRTEPVIQSLPPHEIPAPPSHIEHIPPLSPPQFPASSPPPLVKRRQRSGNTRRAILASVVGVVAIGGISAWLLLNKLQSGSNSTVPNSPTPTPGGPNQLLVYNTHTASVNAVAWSPDGQKIASASDDKLVLICDRNGKTLQTYKGHQDHVNAVAWSPDGKYIASGSADKTVQIWDATSATLVFSYTGHTDTVNAVSWYPDPAYGRRLLASGSDDKTVQAWFGDNNGDALLVYHGHTDKVTSVAWSPSKTMIASGSLDHTLQVCSTIDTNDQAFKVGDQIFSSKPHGENVIYAVAWSPDGTHIASGGSDNLIQVANSTDGTPDKNFQLGHHNKPVHSVAWSPNGNLIVSGGEDMVAHVWDAATGKLMVTYAKHSDSVLALDWSPDSTLIASGSADKTVQLWKSS